MHPHILQTWPRGRQTLAIGVQNLVKKNRKSNLFSQNWSDNDAKKEQATKFLRCF